MSIGDWSKVACKACERYFTLRNAPAPHKINVEARMRCKHCLGTNREPIPFSELGL